MKFFEKLLYCACANIHLKESVRTFDQNFQAKIAVT